MIARSGNIAFGKSKDKGHGRKSNSGKKMKHKYIQSIFIWQIVILLLFMTLTLTNDVLDLPHLFLNDQATTWHQRIGEISVEMAIFIFVIAIETYLFKKLLNRIKILEGFLPICANCKKIRNQADQWEQIEKYIGDHSLARFTHSICPDCLAKLYPEYFNELELLKH